ncbi:MAG: hypothetical protein U9M89_00705 [Patescibacteria group bacterium]|nr:hypothetical protein [Patescibacteria group bacterium]
MQKYLLVLIALLALLFSVSCAGVDAISEVDLPPESYVEGGLKVPGHSDWISAPMEPFMASRVSQYSSSVIVDLTLSDFNQDAMVVSGMSDGNVLILAERLTNLEINSGEDPSILLDMWLFPVEPDEGDRLKAVLTQGVRPVDRSSVEDGYIMLEYDITSLQKSSINCYTLVIGELFSRPGRDAVPMYLIKEPF